MKILDCFINLDNVSIIKKLYKNKYDFIFNNEIRVDTPEGVRIKHDICTKELSSDFFTFTNLQNFIQISLFDDIYVKKSCINYIENDDVARTIRINTNINETKEFNNELCTIPITYTIKLDSKDLYDLTISNILDKWNN